MTRTEALDAAPEDEHGVRRAWADGVNDRYYSERGPSGGEGTVKTTGHAKDFGGNFVRPHTVECEIDPEDAGSWSPGRPPESR